MAGILKIKEYWRKTCFCILGSIIFWKHRACTRNPRHILPRQFGFWWEYSQYGENITKVCSDFAQPNFYKNIVPEKHSHLIYLTYTYTYILGWILCVSPVGEILFQIWKRAKYFHVRRVLLFLPLVTWLDFRDVSL